MAKSIIPSSIVEINEIENGTKFYRNFAFPELSLESGDTDKFVDLVLPFNFWFLSIEFFSGPGSGAKLGDRISALVDPLVNIPDRLGLLGLPTNLGTTQAALNPGDNGVQVHAAVMGNPDLLNGFFRIGAHLYFGADTSGTEYTIIGHDFDNNKVLLAVFDHATKTYTPNSIDTFALGATMHRTIVAGDRISVLPTYDGNVYGASKIGSSKLPANTPFRVHFFKKSGDTDTRDIRVNIEGMVGED